MLLKSIWSPNFTENFAYPRQLLNARCITKGMTNAAWEPDLDYG